MARQLRAEDVADIMDEPDWDDSDASSDEDDEYSPLGLRQAEDSENSEYGSGHTQQTVHAGTLPPQESEQPCVRNPTSATSFSPTRSFSYVHLYVTLLTWNILYHSMTTHLNNVHYVYHMYKI